MIDALFWCPGCGVRAEPGRPRVPTQVLCGSHGDRFAIMLPYTEPYPPRGRPRARRPRKGDLVERCAPTGVCTLHRHGADLQKGRVAMLAPFSPTWRLYDKSDADVVKWGDLAEAVAWVMDD